MSFTLDHPQVKRYSHVFAKNTDNKFAVFFSNHQKDKDLFDDQATPWLDSMEQVFAWKHLFNFHPNEPDYDQDFAGHHKERILKTLSAEEISRLAILGRRVIFNNLTFDGLEPKKSTVGDLAKMQIVDYSKLAQPLNFG